jgi:hypothetical protein
MDREGIGAISGDGLEDGIGGLGPDERLWVVVVGLDVSLQFVDAAMDAALDLLVGQQRKPAFDLVQPGSAGRREVQVIARATGQPGFDRRGLVGGIVVGTRWTSRSAGTAASTAARNRAANSEVVPWRW